MQLWKHNFRGRALIVAITAASCQAFLLLGYDQGKDGKSLHLFRKEDERKGERKKDTKNQS